MKAFILLLAATIGASQAYAADADAVPQVKVFVGDINQGTEAGLAAMYHRIRAAAAQVCAPLESRERLNVDFNKCRQAAIEGAVAQIPALAKYDARKHKSRNG